MFKTMVWLGTQGEPVPESLQPNRKDKGRRKEETVTLHYRDSERLM